MGPAQPPDRPPPARGQCGDFFQPHSQRGVSKSPFVDGIHPIQRQVGRRLNVLRGQQFARRSLDQLIVASQNGFRRRAPQIRRSWGLTLGAPQGLIRLFRHQCRLGKPKIGITDRPSAAGHLREAPRQARSENQRAINSAAAIKPRPIRLPIRLSTPSDEDESARIQRIPHKSINQI